MQRVRPSVSQYMQALTVKADWRSTPSQSGYEEDQSLGNSDTSCGQIRLYTINCRCLLVSLLVIHFSYKLMRTSQICRPIVREDGFC